MSERPLNPPRLMTFGQYAAHANVNPSAISRSVARGTIPTVEHEGKRLIDRVAADEARLRYRDRRKPGGVPEQRELTKRRWRAQAGNGFDLAQLKLLGALWQHGPALVAEGMRHAGATDELDIARGAAVMREIIDYAAVKCFTEYNEAGVGNYETLMPALERPALSDEGAKLFNRLARIDQPGRSDLEDVWPWEFIDRMLGAMEGARVG